MIDTNDCFKLELAEGAAVHPTCITNDSSLDELLLRLASAETRVNAIEQLLRNDPTDRIKRDLATKKVYSAVFVKVEADYYEKTLVMRANILKCDVQQLCKSIIFENTAWTSDNENENDVKDPTNSQFYLVLVQYEAKFDAELLRDLIHGLRPLEKRLPRKRFHFQLAAEAVSSRLGGFEHNAVSPFGLLTDLPIVVCKRCVDLKFPYLYMGGGKVDVKLGISVSDFLRSTGAIVGTISTQRKVLQ